MQDQALALTGEIESSKLTKSSAYIVYVYALQRILILQMLFLSKLLS